MIELQSAGDLCVKSVKFMIYRLYLRRDGQIF